MANTSENIISALGLDTTATETPIPGERRSDFRRSVNMSGVCEFSNTQERVDCSIVDITNSGAQLTMPDTGSVPDQFKLYVVPLNTILDCRVEWRQETRLGVSFTTLSDSIL
ncbi:MAG: PilZ domain-containing protein [Rhizobiales bacterium]|nr:PilZ domain-containing protein [Hyphomicrobiales bacterium]